MISSTYLFKDACREAWVAKEAKPGLAMQSGSKQVGTPGTVSQLRSLTAAKTRQAEPANALLICHRIDQQASLRSRRKANKKPDPWKDPLESEEWNGLRWIIHFLVWMRRSTYR